MRTRGRTPRGGIRTAKAPRAAIAALLTCSLGLVAETPAAGQQDEPVDFSIEATGGGHRSLRSERGRVVVVFYEGRDHARDNEDFKRALSRFLVDNELGEEVTAYAVANVSSVSSVVRGIARTVIENIAEEHGLEILMDWEGTLLAPPFHFSAGAANTSIVDRDGRIVWRHVGLVDDDARRSFYSALRRELRSGGSLDRRSAAN